jgi:hypothetical protein
MKYKFYDVQAAINAIVGQPNRLTIYKPNGDLLKEVALPHTYTLTAMYEIGYNIVDFHIQSYLVKKATIMDWFAE